MIDGENDEYIINYIAPSGYKTLIFKLSEI